MVPFGDVLKDREVPVLFFFSGVINCGMELSCKCFNHKNIREIRAVEDVSSVERILPLSVFPFLREVRFF